MRAAGPESRPDLRWLRNWRRILKQIPVPRYNLIGEALQEQDG